MTYYELVKLVVDDFKQSMNEEGFDSFKEMVRCYQWDSDDIRAEVEYIVNATKKAFMMDSDITIYDGSLEPYKYRDFIRLVRKELN